ncbi:MAG: hypothetical protein LBU32_16555 [Clostridiales bacterium]|jgi:hypothetical protein|nr:hypothetical protein [Clostridiales bacterium]
MENWILVIGYDRNAFGPAQQEWLKYNVLLHMVDTISEAIVHLSDYLEFFKHIPIAIVMSMSHVSGCAVMSRDSPAISEKRPREYQVATGTAMTGNGAILLSGHKVER